MVHRYFIKTPWFVKKIFPGYVWDISPGDNTVYITFDDGPHNEITPWVLNELEEYNAKASFFCIGNNVEKNPGTFRQIIDQGHSIGNHTYSHMNGWKTADKVYLDDIRSAASVFKTCLFRPPYGRIKTSQARDLPAAIQCQEPLVIMWDILSGDFDNGFSAQQCFDNVARNVKAGSIIVFHDSEKAWSNLKFALPASLKYLTGAGFRLEKLQENKINAVI